MTQVDIGSKKPYYVKKDGTLYNHKLKQITGTFTKKYKIHILSFNHIDGTIKRIPLTRLIYKTFYPQIDISDCTITRLKIGIENQYNLYNLERNKNCDMPKKMDEVAKISPYPNRYKTFYNDYSHEKKLELFEDLKNDKNILKKLALKYCVSIGTIHRTRNKVKKLSDENKHQ